jgi:hypothetical protein
MANVETAAANHETRGRWPWWAFAVYLLLHALVVAGLRTPRFPTSPEYLVLSFLGHARRLWTVPLFYKLFPNDTLRIAGQTLFSAVSWWVLAFVAARDVRRREVRFGLRILILTLGLCTSVAAWNTAILSESVSISLTALLIAAWLWFVRWRTLSTAVLATAATLLWTFTRQEHVIVSCAITFIVLAIVARRWRDGVLIALAVVLTAISLYGIVAATRNRDLARYNLAAIVGLRILPNSDYTSWFIAHGMPYTPTVAGFANKYPPEPLADDPVWGAWAQAKGNHVYLNFMLSHPRYTLTGVLPYLSGEQPSLTQPALPPAALSPDATPSLLSPDTDWARHRDVLPRVVQDLLFERGTVGDLIALSIAAFTLVGFAWKRHGWDRRFLVPGIVVASVLPHIYVVWLTSATELDRHAVDIAVSARIGLWLLAAYALDRLVSTPERGPLPVSE